MIDHRHLAYKAFWGLVFIQLMGSACLWAQPAFDNPITLTEAEGLGNDYVTVITRDSGGYMWVGTLGGLSRYDGTHLELFQNDPEDSASLSNNYVLDLLVDREGVLWAATAHGFCRYDPQHRRFRVFLPDINTPGALPGPRVNSVFQDRQGEYWLGMTDRGLVRFNPRRETFEVFFFQVEPRDPRQDVTRLNTVLRVAQDQRQDSILWVATLAGLVRFNKQSHQYRWFYHELPDRDLQYRFNSMRRLLPMPDGKVLVGSWGGAGVFDPQRETFTLIETPEADQQEPFSDKMVTAFLMPRNDEVWITYNAGLLVYDPVRQEPRKVFFNDPEKGKYFGASFIDDNHRIWAATEGGVFLFNPLQNQFPTINFPATAPKMLLIARAVVERAGGRELVFCLDDSEGLYIYDRPTGQWSIVPAPAPFRNQRNRFPGQDMIRLKDGRVVVLTRDRLLEYDEKNRRLRALPFDFTRESPFFRRMVEDDQGRLWIGSRRLGLFRIDLQSGEVRQYRQELEAVKGDNRFVWIEELLKDSAGNLWIRASSGYSFYDIRRDTIYNISYDERQPRRSFIYAHNFEEDDQGRIWIAGDQWGLGMADPARPAEGLVRKFGRQEGLPNENVQVLCRDQQGNIWMDHERGLTRLDPRTLDMQYFDRAYGKPPTTFDLMEHLSTGEIAMSTEKGICLFHPDSLQINQERPRSYLTSFKVFDRELISAGSALNMEAVQLSYRQNFFSFEFSAIGYNLPQLQSFAYKLEGFDDEWIDAGRRKYASYTNVDGGNYVLKIRVANSEGVWSDEPFALRIHITTPWWRTWWFWAILTLALVTIATLIVRWRINQVRHKEYLKSEFERKLAAVEMHALRAQMNPHFIFNCLNSIDYYILKNETEKASDYLNRFSRLIRLILQNSRSNYVNLRDELEALKLYIEMESLRFDCQFDYEVRVDKDLNLEDIEIPPMILQPYVENAIWHGLMQKGGKGRLELIITRENSHLHCVIQDNGIGREAAMALRSKSAGRRKSMGMQITSDRLGMINKMFNKNAVVRVEDLHDPEGRPAGTRVELKIPL